MSKVNSGKTLREHLDTYLAALPRPGLELTSAEAEEGQNSKQFLVKAGSAAVPVLLDRLPDPDFSIKDACYDLVLEIGKPAQAALSAELGKRGAIVDIWIAAMLHYLGDENTMQQLRQYLHDPAAYVRHLAALALAFKLIDSTITPSQELLAVLVDALGDEQQIEGTPFTIAGSALGCLTRLSGENFLPQPKAIQFYNFEHFLYPPPVHPFPFAADYLTKAAEEEKLNIIRRVKAWAVIHGVDVNSL